MIKHINDEYPNASLKVDKEGRDLFYEQIMHSNRTDYSKYKNDKKAQITAPMRDKLFGETGCPYLRKYIENRELIKTGNINEAWARNHIKDNQKDLRDLCLKEVDTLANNVVRRCKESFEVDGTDDLDKICIWICRYVIDNWVETTGAEFKIEAKLRQIETVTIEDIDRCSTKKLEKYLGRIRTIYNRFNIIYQYKNTTGK